MGDVRFSRPFHVILAARDKPAALRALSDEEVVEALAAAAGEGHAVLANVLATEATNRIRRLRAALVNLGEGIVALSTDGRVQWMNPAAEALLGCARSEAVTRPFEELVDHLDDAGLPIPAERSPIRRACHEGYGRRVECEMFRTAARGAMWVSYTCSPILGPSGLEGAVLAFQDASERIRRDRELHEAHERYKSLFELGPYGIVSVSASGTVIDANPAAEALIGRPIQETRGRAFLEYLHPEDAGRVLEVFADVLAGQRRDARLRVLHRDGHYVEVQASGIPLVVDGKVVGIHSIVRALSPEDQTLSALGETVSRSGTRADPARDP